VRLADGNPSATDRLFAVVVPNLKLLRARRMVNVGDILRFELEGQSIHLPADKRVPQYAVWFEPLPRTSAGKLDREQIERRLQNSGIRGRLEAVPADSPWSNDRCATAVAQVIADRGKTRFVTGQSNLEIDLGFDSLERVALFTELEQAFRVRIPDEEAHHILTAGDLIEAVRRNAQTATAGSAEEPWRVILRDLPPEDDALLSGVVAERPIASRVFFMLSRLVRALLPTVKVRGLEHVPRSGPFIISPNHQGYLDPFIVCGAVPFRIFRQMFFVGAAEYFETRFMAWIARKGNCVPVDPDANLVPAMKAGAFGLMHGKILLLFPEGERSIDGTVKRFKKGAVILSKHLNVPLVPVAVRGTYDLWPRNRPINWRLMLPWSGHRVRLAFGPPMRFAPSAQYAEAAAELQAEVTRMWNELD
jgi:long-chain acyl-CoA synthetase